MTSHAATLRHAPDYKLGADLFHRCLAGSAALGVITLLVIQLTPVTKQVIQAVTAEPVRMARLVVEQPPVPSRVIRPELKPGLAGPGGPVAGTPGTGALGRTPPHPVADADAGTNPVPSRGGGGTGTAPGLGSGAGDGNGGAVGRARAAAVSAQVASATRARSTVPSPASTPRSLASGSSSPPVGGGRRSRAVAAGRSNAELGGVRADLAATAAARTGGSVVPGARLEHRRAHGRWRRRQRHRRRLRRRARQRRDRRQGGIGGGSGGGVGGGVGGGAGDGWAGGGAGGGGGGGAGGGGNGGRGWGGTPGAGGRGAAPPGVYRSNASLLAVIQKYQAGIQYCYGNELKKHDGLRGKLVVALTVDASGNVTDATVVQNTLGSPAIASCALSQIRDWKFPAIPVGVTAFQVPFVFTPPTN